MPLVFAAISPHPPIIIPEIGKEDTKRTEKTVRGLKELAKKFEEAEIDTLIVVSPHNLVYPDRFNICGMEKLSGNFAHFGAPKITFKLENNLVLAEEIADKAESENIRCLLYDNDAEEFELDHGTLVPLYYLSENKESSFKLIPMAYSFLDRASHFTFGQIIKEIADKSQERIGIVASGDLSHRLFQGTLGNPQAGKDFDQLLIKDLENQNFEEIMCYDEETVDEAGECGYRSIITLLGALGNENAKPEILSYEGPFGVGYLVANFNLNKEK